MKYLVFVPFLLSGYLVFCSLVKKKLVLIGGFSDFSLNLRELYDDLYVNLIVI